MFARTQSRLLSFLSNGVFRDVLKIARVVPIHKNYYSLPMIRASLYLVVLFQIELFTVLQNDIVKIRAWLNNNKLSLNISKINYMIMTNRKKVQQNDDFQLSIDGQTISQVNETKFLGVMIDDKMTFKSHINHINLAGKMSKGVGNICKARK